MKKARIEGYENYWIYEDGSVYNSKTNKFIKPRKTKAGYLYVALCKKSKYKLYYIHRLVAHYFINKKHEGLEVNHKDGNKQNNCVDNLEWVTHKSNIHHAISANLISYAPEDNCMSKVNWEIVNYIRYNYVNFPLTYFSEKFKISEGLVSMIIHNKVWKSDDYTPPNRKKEVFNKSFVSTQNLF